MEGGGNQMGAEVEEAIRDLQTIFPAYPADVVARHFMEHFAPGSLVVVVKNQVADLLLGMVPPVETRSTAGETSGAASASTTAEDPFELKPVPPDCAILYKEWCLFRLQCDFPRVSLTDVRRALKLHMGRIGPTHRAVKTAFSDKSMKIMAANSTPSAVDDADSQIPVDKGKGKSTQTGSGVNWLPQDGVRLLQRERPLPKALPKARCPLFDQDWEAVKAAYSKEIMHDDMQLAEDLNEKEYAASGQEIECGCCCSDFPFEKMVQCADGHLFCFDCIRRRVEESTFGGMQASGPVLCMNTDGCEETFPLSEIKRALPANILAKYEERQAEDSIVRAQLEGLVRCPFCEYPVEMDPEQRVLHCPGCSKRSCRSCKEPDHVPLRCDEVKKETDVRKLIEEEMTKACVRTCPSCKAELVKNEGCNKVTCRCGKAMCYICKEAVKDYNHFCKCPHRNKNEACQTCKKCSLWATEDEDEQVKKARENIMKEIAEKEPELLKRPIGPPDEGPQPKRQRAVAVGGEGQMLGFPPDAFGGPFNLHRVMLERGRAGFMGQPPPAHQNPPPNPAQNQVLLPQNYGPNIPRGYFAYEGLYPVHPLAQMYGLNPGFRNGNIDQHGAEVVPPPANHLPAQGPQGVHAQHPHPPPWAAFLDRGEVLDPHALAAMPDPPAVARNFEGFHGHNLRG